MRQLAWLLLLANLGMLAWLVTQPEPQPARYRPVPVPPGIEPLVLLSERSFNTTTANDQVAPETAASSGAQHDAEVSEDADRVPSAEIGEERDADEPDITSVAQAAAVPEPLCQAIGPFMQQADAEGVGQQLAALGYQPSLRTGEVRNPAGYWVYMPAMPAAEARRIVAELDAHGMTDYYIGKQNYISLGIFSGKKKAQMRLEQIEQLGFDAILDQRFRTRAVYWVDIRQGGVPLLVSEIWPQIQAQHTEIRVQRISCE